MLTNPVIAYDRILLSTARLLILVLIVLSPFKAVTGQNGPVIPAWVHPGLVVSYDGISAFVNNGRFSQGIQVVMTTRVTAISGNKASGITQIQTVGTPIGQRHSWTCTAAADCASDMPGFSGKFWVDPANPLASIKGSNGERYSMIGKGPYSHGGRSWEATTISYQNPATGWQLVCTFESKTGLVLAYSETSPGQQVHTYFRSTNGR